MQKVIRALLAFALSALFTACGADKAADTTDSIILEQGATEIKLALAAGGTLNPLETTSRNVQSIMNIVYEPLFTVDESLNAVPVLAESYAMSEDGRKITVKLRGGIKWHDGTPFTADDVVYTWSRLKNSNGLYKNTAKKITGVTRLSNDTVEMDFAAQELDFSYLLTFPVLSKNTKYLTDFLFVPIGTGSYKYGGRSENEITLEPNGAWRGEPKPQKRIAVKLLKDDKEIVQAFNVNQADAILSEEAVDGENPPKSSAQLKKIVSDNLIFLGFNTGNPFLTCEIRRAIGASVDKTRLLEQAAYGYGKVCDISVNPDSWAYEGVKPGETSWTDIAKMLENAGYIQKNNVYYKDGQAIELELLVNADKPQRVTLAETVAETLTGAGFTVRVNAIAYKEYLKRIKSGDFDMFLGVTPADSPINPTVLLDGDSNLFNFDVSRLMQLKSSLYGVTDKEAYKKTVKVIASEFAEDPPYIPLFYTTCGVYYGSDVMGITEPTLSDRYKNIESWYFYSNMQNGEK